MVQNTGFLCNFQIYVEIMHIFVILTIFWPFVGQKVPIFRKKTVKTGKLYDFILHIFGKFNLKLSVTDKKDFYLKGGPPFK